MSLNRSRQQRNHAGNTFTQRVMQEAHSFIWHTSGVMDRVPHRVMLAYDWASLSTCDGRRLVESQHVRFPSPQPMLKWSTRSIQVANLNSQNFSIFLSLSSGFGPDTFLAFPSTFIGRRFKWIQLPTHKQIPFQLCQLNAWIANTRHCGRAAMLHMIHMRFTILVWMI